MALEVYSGTLAPSDTSLIGRRLQFLPPTYLFSKDLLASIGLDWLQWSLQLYIIPELKLPRHMIHCPPTALTSFLDRTTAWRKGKVSFS